MTHAMNRLGLTLLCFGLLVPRPLPACRYNVRDVGFADLEPAAYRLFVFAGQRTSAMFDEALRQGAAALFNDANVQLRLVASDAARGSEAEQLAREHHVGPSAAAILVAPDGRSLVLPFPSLTLSPEESAVMLLNTVLVSSRRDAVLTSVIESFAVVLLIEGTDAQGNRRARAAAEGAIAEFSKILERLPKKVRVPPVAQIISAAEAGRERILLWSLGVTNAISGEPSVAVLHGRGRLIGPVLSGARATEPSIFRILHVLGQDCECDLDRAWLRGPLLPARWDAGRQAAGARELGFDPENPLVKAEMKSILERGLSSTRPRLPFPEANDAALLGYRETSVEAPIGTAPSSTGSAVTNVVGMTVGMTVIRISAPWLAVGVIAFIALAGGFILLLKGRAD